MLRATGTPTCCLFHFASQNLPNRRRSMFTKRHALMTGILFLLLFTSACGAAAATQAPATKAPLSDYNPEEFAATEAPAATQDPSYIPQEPASEAPVADDPS